ncbi:uncharacterized protein LOC143301246 isoform X2 [Babylonia areolata]|uniref:uncharacterized protein LOC143301246 isoform X2 n=1 Tax=Babylonia areolata TaxID=304850 RepID=UPI003FD1A9EC
MEDCIWNQNTADFSGTQRFELGAFNKTHAEDFQSPKDNTSSESGNEGTDFQSLSVKPDLREEDHHTGNIDSTGKFQFVTEFNFVERESGDYVIVDSEIQSNETHVRQTSGQGADILEASTLDLEQETENDAGETSTGDFNAECPQINKEIMGCANCKKADNFQNQGQQTSLLMDQEMGLERQNNLSRQRRNTEEIDLPESMITFFKCHFYIIENEIPGVKILQRNNGTEFLQVTSEQSQHDLFGLLSRFFSCQIPVDAAHTLYLDSPEGYEAMKRIEKRNECVIKTHPPSILLTATSCGHTVCVHEGRIENNNCQVLVLPLCAERSVWSPQIQHILRRDMLTGIEEDYARWIGPSPKAGNLFLRCPLDRTRSVVVIHVPQTIGGKEADYIRGTLKNFMKKAAERRESVAIPYDLFIKSGLRKEIILQSIVDVFSGNTPASLLKLYLDAGNSETSVLRENISTFLEHREWSCDFAGGRSVRMHVGDVLDLKADVIVNSSHKMLDMTHGQLSQVLLKAAGPELSKQCKARYPKGIDDHVVAVTDCFQLKAFQKIFHILLPSMNAKVQDIRYPHLEWIRTRTQACLALASAMGYKSIVFPTLGVGTLFYLPQEVAETMFTTFREFFNEMPHSSLHDVTVVCFPKNTAVFQHFKMAEIKFALQEDMNSISEVVMEVKGVQIQIIQCDVQQHTCAADVVIVAKGAEKTVMSDGLKPDTHSVCQENIDKDFSWILSSVGKRLLLFCLQINLETFKRRYYQDVVAAVVKCLREAKNLKVVTFVVLTPKEHQEVREAFEKASQRSFPAPQHAMAPGQKKAPNTASPAGKVQICGELRFVENATKEILQLQIPEKFQAEEEIQKMDQSFMESSVDGKEFQQGRQDGGDISIVQKTQ